VSDVLVLAVVLLLAGSGYAAGRIHAELGYRTGFRLGYRQGHADATRRGRVGSEPVVTVQPAGLDGPTASDSRQNGVVVGAGSQKVRHARG
jgi:hypothetical protein